MWARSQVLTYGLPTTEAEANVSAYEDDTIGEWRNSHDVTLVQTFQGNLPATDPRTTLLQSVWTWLERPASRLCPVEKVDLSESSPGESRSEHLDPLFYCLHGEHARSAFGGAGIG